MSSAVKAFEYINGFSQLPQTGTTYVDIGGQQSLPVQAFPSPGARTLTVLFHGAINRTLREYPAFLRPIRGLSESSHQISIADVGLLASDQTTNGWFIGTRSTPLQDLLPPFIENLAAALDVERVVFVGSSGGGFGALYYSWRLPESIAVVQVPQTNIYAYYKGRREAYIPAAWGDALQVKDSTPCFDLRDVYSRGMSNTVVYLQSTLDDHHMANHMTPFVASLSPDSLRRVALRVSYWGKDGHSGVVPEGERDAWVRATIAADDVNAPDIVHSYDIVNPGTFRVSQSRPQGPQKIATNKYLHRDLELSDKLAQKALETSEAAHG